VTTGHTLLETTVKAQIHIRLDLIQRIASPEEDLVPVQLEPLTVFQLQAGKRNIGFFVCRHIQCLCEAFTQTLIAKLGTFLNLTFTTRTDIHGYSSRLFTRYSLMLELIACWK
jgi:hypothetical protein